MGKGQVKHFNKRQPKVVKKNISKKEFDQIKKAKHGRRLEKIKDK